MLYDQNPGLWLPDINGNIIGNSVLLLVANNALKDTLAQTLDTHHQVIQDRYDAMAGTTGTLEQIVKKRFPNKQFIDLGHGPAFGDIWTIVFALQQLAIGRRLESLILLDPNVEHHQPFKLALLLGLLKMNATLLPTAASADTLYSALAAAGIEHALLPLSASTPA